MRQLTDAEFDEALRSFTGEAFRLETRDSYLLDYERDVIARFAAGQLQSPAEYSWWQAWLDQISDLARRGSTVRRVRVLAEPPTAYQRLELWADPWHTRAGEQIRYMSGSHAVKIGLPLTQDWWLLDSTRLILMDFDATGRPASKFMIIDPGAVSAHRNIRDLAWRNSSPAQEFAAA